MKNLLSSILLKKGIISGVVACSIVTTGVVTVSVTNSLVSIEKKELTDYVEETSNKELSTIDDNKITEIEVDEPEKEEDLETEKKLQTLQL